MSDDLKSCLESFLVIVGIGGLLGFWLYFIVSNPFAVFLLVCFVLMFSLGPGMSLVLAQQSARLERVLNPLPLLVKFVVLLVVLALLFLCVPLLWFRFLEVGDGYYAMEGSLLFSLLFYSFFVAGLSDPQEKATKPSLSLKIVTFFIVAVIFYFLVYWICFGVDCWLAPVLRFYRLFFDAIA